MVDTVLMPPLPILNSDATLRALTFPMGATSHEPHVAIEQMKWGLSELRWTVSTKYHGILLVKT